MIILRTYICPTAAENPEVPSCLRSGLEIRIEQHSNQTFLRRNSQYTQFENFLRWFPGVQQRRNTIIGENVGRNFPKYMVRSEQPKNSTCDHDSAMTDTLPENTLPIRAAFMPFLLAISLTCAPYNPHLCKVSDLGWKVRARLRAGLAQYFGNMAIVCCSETSRDGMLPVSGLKVCFYPS